MLTVVLLTCDHAHLREPSTSVTPFGCRFLSDDQFDFDMENYSEEDMMAWFNPAEDNKAVDIEHIQDFLNAAAAVNFMEPLAADYSCTLIT